MSLPSSFKLTLQTPEETVFQGECVSLYIATDDGVIEVLPGHANLLSTVKYSIVTVKLPDETEKVYVVRLGLLFVNNEKDEVSINAFACELQENVKHETILEYHKEILEKLKAGDLTPLQVTYLENQSESIKEMVEVREEK